MTGLSAGTRNWIAAGVTDMRCSFEGLAAKVQSVLEGNAFGGDVFVSRGRRGGTVKILCAMADGLCVFSRRLESGHSVWPEATAARSI